MNIRYTSNASLPTVREGWAGTPITAKKRFVNHEYPFVPQFSEIFKWKLRPNPLAAEKKRDKWRATVTSIDHIRDLPDNSVTWLGHATFCIRLSGYTLLTDPIMGSPTPLMHRFADFPTSAKGLAGVDLLLISHDHRDHVDGSSLKKFFRHNPRTDVFTGLNMSKLLSKYSTRSNRIMEAGWWQQYPHPDLEIVYLPTRHWGKRSLNDTNRRLWGSFYISDGKRSIFFGGDSGYGSHYKDYGQHFGGVDMALLGIGAFEPEWFMHPSHTSPSDALRAADDLGARVMLPMHYGTFDLSDEPISMPYRRVMKKQASSSDLELTAAMPGEPVLLDQD